MKKVKLVWTDRRFSCHTGTDGNLFAASVSFEGGAARYKASVSFEGGAARYKASVSTGCRTIRSSGHPSLAAAKGWCAITAQALKDL